MIWRRTSSTLTGRGVYRKCFSLPSTVRFGIHDVTSSRRSSFLIHLKRSSSRASLVKFINQQAPIRIGVVLICPEALNQVTRLRRFDELDVTSSNKTLEAMASQKQFVVSADGEVSASTGTGTTASNAVAEPAAEEYSHQATVAAAIIAAFESLSKGRSHTKGFSFLTRLATLAKGEHVTEDEVKRAFKSFGSYDAVVGSTTAVEGLKTRALYLVDRGMTSQPLTLFNGLLTKGKSARDALFEGIQREQPHVRSLIADGVLKDDIKDLHKAILDHGNAGTRYHPLVFGSTQVSPLRADHPFLASGSFVESAGCSPCKVTLVLVADLGKVDGLSSLVAALRYFAIDDSPRSVRLAVAHKTASVASIAYEALVESTNGDALQASTLLQFVLVLHRAAASAAAGVTPEFVSAVVAAMDEASVGGGEQTDDGAVYKRQPTLRVQVDKERFEKLFASGDPTGHVGARVGALRDAGGGSEETPVLLANGRRLPLGPEQLLISEDYATLVNLEITQRVDRILKVFSRHTIFPTTGCSSTETCQQQASIIASVASILANDWFKNGERTAGAPKAVSETTPYAFAVPPKEDLAGPGEPTVVDVVAIINPLSAEAQKLSTFLATIHSTFHSRISVYLNPHAHISELPLRSFYRYVLEPSLQFDAVTGTILPPSAYFTNLPLTKILTLGIDEPEAWIVSSTYAPYDMDNVELGAYDKSTLYAEYELEHIMVTGSCVDVTQGSPPRGLELVMRNDANAADTHDTLVMSNYGYFQLKGNPGIWRLALKGGSRGEAIFDIAGQFSIEVSSQQQGYTTEQVTNVEVGSFSGAYIYLKVVRKEGQEEVDLLAEDDEDPLNMIRSAASSVSSLFSSRTNKKVRAGPTLNIFSVASGHLYERLTKVMIHTVTNHTKATPDSRVKFWFLKNFLSPQFKRFLPEMAQKWGFEYELVTYKWPHWLRRQTEKQRIIWAYKILFLDVLFPLSLDKVIFVDADQIVRTDLHELYNMDIKGHALAYTPFCDSNTETEGFRFWKQGYWRDHLQGRPYHISALYVVDIKKFRKMAAGDNLRMIYDNLSQDPNSLANLDQDLPNYAQYMVPIYSLPTEWLWCETWCSNKTKSAAKTIDLCNNPLTKMPKLVNARRIVPEWDSYDQEIAKFEESLNLTQW
eukprot:NODE_14_length_5049_cov_16.675000_g11_i0.p1 GENE.NODE_14_length_5049_cov_16.675000_g11_i0~~NODE_14_length_5049_cov_16.675000_g11_i0.p1  ORF type:complete len:1151 (-),score=219.10 NODE_14_length_5049_cov_16.675000_g11_i0:117-3569(-)